MLRFFRKLRQKLLDEGYIRKYLVYAVGEIVLVMIGILLALQINNWNELRKEKAREISYLNRLHENMTFDKERIHLNIEFYQSVLDKGELALAFSNDEDVSDYSEWEILVAFFHASQIGPMIPTSTTYEELKSAGELSLIRNSELRDRLSFYFGTGQSRYDDTIGINPPYRKLSREKIPYHIQSYMWDNCHGPDGDSQKLLECDSNFADTEIIEITSRFKEDEKLIGELGFWMSSIRAGWQPMMEQQKLTEQVIAIINQELNTLTK